MSNAFANPAHALAMRVLQSDFYNGPEIKPLVDDILALHKAMTTPSKSDTGELPDKLEINEEYSFVAYPDGRIALDGNVYELERELVRRYNLCPKLQEQNAKLAEALRAVLAGYSPYTAINEETLHEAGTALAEHDQSKQ